MSKDKIFNSISDILVEFPPITDKHGDNVEKLSETVCATVSEFLPPGTQTVGKELCKNVLTPKEEMGHGENLVAECVTEIGWFGRRTTQCFYMKEGNNNVKAD